VDEFEQIYLAHFDGVYRFALTLSRDASLAEEIAQETFFKALRAIDGFSGECSLYTWLCQIAKNAYFSHVRKHRKFAPIPEGFAETQDDADGAEQNLLSLERTAAMHRALHALTEPYKEVFTLRVFAELSYAQIAPLFDRTESWCRVTFYRAKSMLQDRMKEEK